MLDHPPFFEITPVLTYLEFPTGLNQSPDFNPIEMVWDEMKAFITSKFCKNLNETKDAILEYKKI